MRRINVSRPTRLICDWTWQERSTECCEMINDMPRDISSLYQQRVLVPEVLEKLKPCEVVGLCNFSWKCASVCVCAHVCDKERGRTKDQRKDITKERLPQYKFGQVPLGIRWKDGVIHNKVGTMTIHNKSRKRRICYLCETCEVFCNVRGWGYSSGFGEHAT